MRQTAQPEKVPRAKPKTGKPNVVNDQPIPSLYPSKHSDRAQRGRSQRCDGERNPRTGIINQRIVFTLITKKGARLVAYLLLVSAANKAPGPKQNRT